MENTGFGYFAKDVAADLEITTSTLRRWSIELEKVNYKIERNDKEQRIYYERDFKAFRELKKLLSHSVPFVDAIKAVASTDLENKNAHLTPSVFKDEVRLSKRELQDIIQLAVKQAVEEEREFISKAIDQKLDNLIESRDRLLVQQLNKALEEKKEAAATIEEEKKPWWKSIFSAKKD